MVEAYAERFKRDPDEVLATTPLARITIWIGAGLERMGMHSHRETPVMRDWLDNLEPEGGLSALCARMKEDGRRNAQIRRGV